MFTNKRRQNAHINIVPYIDVMLVLLIVFMITTPLLTEGVQVNLPAAKARVIDSDVKDDRLIVSVTQQSRYFFALNGNQQFELSQHELLNQARELFSRYPKLKIYIKADKAIDYGVVVDLMADLQQAGFNSIGLITAPELNRV